MRVDRSHFRAAGLARYLGATVASVLALGVAAALESRMEGAYLVFPIAVIALVALRFGLAVALVGLAAALPGVILLLVRSPEHAADWHPQALLFTAAAAGGAAGGAWIRRLLRAAEEGRDAAAARERRARLLAALAVEAVAAPSVEPLLRQLLSVLREGLDVGVAWLDPLERAAIPSVVAGRLGRCAELADAARAQAELAAASRRPVVAADLEGETRFDPRAMLERAVRSSATVPVPAAGGAPGEVLAVVGVASERPRPFTGGEVAFLQLAAALLGAATARLGAERRLRDHLAFSRTITDHIGEGVCAVDGGGRVTLLNPAGRRLLGVEEEDVVGRPFHEVVHARCGSSGCPVPAALGAGAAVEHEVDTFVRPDGQELLASWRAHPLTGGGAGAIFSFVDVTRAERRRRQERVLAELSRRIGESLELEATLAAAAAAPIPELADFCLVALVRQPSECHVLVESGVEGLAAAARALLARPESVLAPARGVRRVLETGAADRVSRRELDALRNPLARLLRDAGIREVVALPLLARGERIGAIELAWIREGALGPDAMPLLEELATRCAAGLEQALLYREAREAARARDEVLAVVSHDLKNPLGAILAGAGLAARIGAGDERIRKVATSIDRAAQRMDRLIRDLCDLAALDAGRLGLTREPVDAGALCREAVEMLEPLATDAAVRLEAGEAAGTPPVVCDRERILQVLSNLVGNAIKATPEGGRVRVDARPGGARVTFTVEDTGCGIGPASLPHVFERYWRGQGTQYRGSGIGLAIARALVEAHGGRIWVESQEGVGSTFGFDLRAGWVE